MSKGAKIALKSRLQGFVLAGGRSHRMGFDKARLVLDHQPLLLRTLNLLRPHVASVAVLGTAGGYDFLTDPVIPDREPGRGPLAAIQNGLEHSLGDWALFLACDMPLLNSGFVELLLEFIANSEADAVIPRTRLVWQPLCGAYRKTASLRIREVLCEGKSAIVEALPRLRVDVITDDDLVMAGLSQNIFDSVNYPEDWRRILNLASTR